MGHEITHAFDATGRNFNSKGNIKNWWANQSAEHFKKRSECFLKQYSNYKIENKNLNSYMTLDENIADNGGVKLAFHAYKQFLKEHNYSRLNRVESNEEFTNEITLEKLFFIGFAQAFCSVSTKKHAQEAIINDPHSFAKYRVIGALTNSFEFSKTFNCPLNSPMNPPEKCRIW